MTNIPFDAIGSSSSVQQAQTNQAIRARQVQSKKNDHHAEDVQELDDTAVDAVGDEKQEGEGKNSKKKKKARTGEIVDIAGLKGQAGAVAPSGPSKTLDISA